MNQNPNNGESLKVLPRIKINYLHTIYETNQEANFIGNPLPGDMEIPDNQQPIIRKLYEDIILCFAIDKGDWYELLQKETLLNNPHLHEDVLYQISVNTLIQEIEGQIQIHGDPNDLVMVTAGGNFEASIILIDDFWEQMHQIFKDDLILILPARDILMIAKASNQQAFDKMKEIINNYFENPETQGLLSKALYKRAIGQTTLQIIDTAF